MGRAARWIVGAADEEHRRVEAKGSYKKSDGSVQRHSQTRHTDDWSGEN
jgi:hypothetical protein